MNDAGSEARKQNAISYVDGHRLSRAVAAGIRQVVQSQEHLNKINVFPVADGDTGTNLALTMSSILGSLRNHTEIHVGRTMMHIADAALDGARGNSGAIIAQYFQGISDTIIQCGKMTAAHFADAVTNGEQYARDALSKPREGTVLTVMRDFSQRVSEAVQIERVSDFVVLLALGLERARVSLAKTPDQLDALKKAGVVDAGAEGFVRFIEGITLFISSGNIADPIPAGDNFEAIHFDEEMAGEIHDLDHRYCTECLVTADQIDRRKLKEELSAMGSSLVLAGTTRKAKIHIHVNEPAKVFDVAAAYGEVSHEKADDMHQQQGISHHGDQSVAIAVDSAADLPEELIAELGIHMIPVRLHFGDESYLDKVTITSAEFFDKLQSHPQHPKTSQPSPGEFRRNFDFLASHYAHVLSVQVTSWGSGTYQAAMSAAERSDHDSIHVFDSRSASIGQGLQAIHAAECARSGMTIEQVVASTTKARDDTRVFGLFPNLHYTVRGGRVKPWVKTIADWFNLIPVFSIKSDGKLLPHRVLIGHSNIAVRLARLVARRLEQGGTYRLAIACGNNHHEAEQLRDQLLALASRKGATIEQNFITSIGAALGVHAGPSALALGLQRRDHLDDAVQPRSDPE